MTTLHDIELATENYRAARDQLASALDALEQQKRELVRERLPAIKQALHHAQTRRDELQHLLEANKTLFEKPRTRTWHGVKVGWRKMKGKLIIEDRKRTLELIKKRLPDQAERLIRISESPNAAALGELPGADLKRIGCHIDNVNDEIVIKPVDGEIDKLIETLLNDDPTEAP